MCNVEWDHPARELFKQQKILTLPSLVIFEVAKYVRGNIKQFKTWADSHKHCTRGRHRLKLPQKRLCKSGKHIDFLGVKVYNALPEHIVTTQTYSVFVKKLKMLLIHKAFYSVDEFLTDKSRTDPYPISEQDINKKC